MKLDESLRELVEKRMDGVAKRARDMHEHPEKYEEEIRRHRADSLRINTYFAEQERYTAPDKYRG